MIKVTRLYSDIDGETHFQDTFIPVKDNGKGSLYSDFAPSTGVEFRTAPKDYNMGFHNTPRKQYIVIIKGGVEMETSLGEIRQFHTGDIILIEDTTGKGHKSRAINNQERLSVFIGIED